MYTTNEEGLQSLLNFEHILCLLSKSNTSEDESEHYHITPGSEDTFLKTLEGHPLDWQSTSAPLAAVIVPLINVARQTEVSNFDVHTIIQPATVSQ